MGREVREEEMVEFDGADVACRVRWMESGRENQAPRDSPSGVLTRTFIALNARKVLNPRLHDIYERTGRTRQTVCFRVIVIRE